MFVRTKVIFLNLIFILFHKPGFLVWDFSSKVLRKTLMFYVDFLVTDQMFLTIATEISNFKNVTANKANFAFLKGKPKFAFN